RCYKSIQGDKEGRSRPRPCVPPQRPSRGCAATHATARCPTLAPSSAAIPTGASAMDISVLIWILAAAVLLTPLLQRRLLEGARRRLRERIERERGSRVILLVHREESMNLFGFNLMRFLDVQDSEEIVRAIMQTE